MDEVVQVLLSFWKQLRIILLAGLLLPAGG